MYKAINTKKTYWAINTFRKTAKSLSKVYNTGFHFFETDDMKIYSIVIGTFRIMFGIKKDVRACCN